eukprot:CAMPEP_0194409264 /NCGR_PEP_ID=MMETSP0176-20130528/7112_1 /TAXON_ID=216777 /ORGANISM="Proboscia alata, Strain PI-D3" /LENGTH=682 /DNA_ID=CAMNT_0039209763 /DNA_START=101 /DNA_END=2146 /DNA_ORIENTATION=+
MTSQQQEHNQQHESLALEDGTFVNDKHPQTLSDNKDKTLRFHIKPGRSSLDANPNNSGGPRSKPFRQKGVSTRKSSGSRSGRQQTDPNSRVRIRYAAFPSTKFSDDFDTTTTSRNDQTVIQTKNAERLSVTIADAGIYSAGVDAIEVWGLNGFTGCLVRPMGGWWCRPDDITEKSSSSSSISEVLETVPSRMIPGVDLPGILWAESLASSHTALPLNRDENVSVGWWSKSLGRKSFRPAGIPLSFLGGTSKPTAKHWSKSDKPKLFGGSSGSVILPSIQGATQFASTHAGRHTPNHSNNPSGNGNSNSIQWRDLQSLIIDPDTSCGQRLTSLYKSGMRQAAAVPFHVRDHLPGIVIYLTREPTTRTQTKKAASRDENVVINSLPNQVYMRSCAELIGATIATNEARKVNSIVMDMVSASSRQSHSSQAESITKQPCGTKRENPTHLDISAVNNEDVRKDLKNREGTLTNTISTLDISDADDSEKISKRHLCWQTKLQHPIQMWLRKLRGGNLQIPPPIPLGQCLFLTMGSFTSLLLISFFNEFIKRRSNGAVFILMGPIGALVTLQHALTAAPASQPRNVIWGQVISGFVSILITILIPERILSHVVRVAFAPALSIGVMAALGIVHPPAGAAAVIYAYHHNENTVVLWTLYICVVLASVLSLIPAILWNNINVRRQYPTHW